MKSANLTKTFLEGLWFNNPGAIQLLGLCPLLAVSTRFTTALTLGLATLFVLVCSNGLVSLFGRRVPDHLRLPFYVMLIAGWVTLIQLILSMYFYELYESLGIFLALITTNCVILARAEGYASKQTLGPALWDGFTQGFGFLVLLCILGGLREFLGQYFILASMPAGAFLILGLFLGLLKVR